MKEMIERLIADGWEWVAKDEDEEFVFIYTEKPRKSKQEKISFYPDGGLCENFLACLLPEITPENSPVELKTLLVDDEEESEGEHHKIVQKEIASLLEKNYSFLIRDFEEDVIAVTEDGKRVEYNVSCFLSKLCPTKYEKVYLKDLLKKRKVKKSVWVAVDEDKQIYLYSVKPKRSHREFEAGVFEASKVEDLDFLTGVLPTWEDEPIELIYEVEE